MTTRSRLVAGSVLTLALALMVVAAHGGGSPPPASGQARERPNVILIMTDDQAAASVRYMRSVRTSLARRGTTFRQSFVSYPLCCPSRATFLTGQYAHNHRVLENGSPTGGYQALDHARTLPVSLQRSGYYTAHIGKYLNGYGQSNAREVPPGWSRWMGSVDPSTYRMTDYTLNVNGKLVRRGSSAADYQTDVYGRAAETIIGERAPSRAPFFLSVAFLAPHDERQPGKGPNPRPAPRHAGQFAGLRAPRPPSFNERRNGDKPAFVRQRPPITPSNVKEVDKSWRDRARSLLSVDEAVGGILRKLRATGELDNTVILFTSDNGFFHGEYRIGRGKYLGYDPATRVPLIVRGPGVRANRRVNRLVSNIDLAPTILDLANARSTRRADGMSLTGLLRGSRRAGRTFGRRSLLFEAGDGRSVPPSSGEPSQQTARAPERAPDYAAVRTSRYLYIRTVTGERELYDLRRDRYLLQNRRGSRRYRSVERTLSRRLSRLRRCGGRGCRR